jgi:3-deoxy-D-manno-octulosonate 8-phosphate phosphatase (KDO 8-P phosphatase)
MTRSLDQSGSSHPADALVLARVAPALRERLEAVQLMVFDVDGVLTDGSLYYSEHGEAMKRFNVLDGHGLRLLRESGAAVALITGRSGPILARRAAELGIDEVLQGVRDKGEALETLAQRLGVTLGQSGFMGDDIIDLPAMQRAGFAASVPNAPIYVSQTAHWVSRASGGNGAVRECCDLLMAARGRLGQFLSSPGMLGPGAIQ